MLIHPDLITTWGGKTKIFKRNDFIFMEDEEPKWFFQILKGKVRMFNSNEDGREFTQGSFQEGDSFGEPPLLISRSYPASAQAIEESIIQMLERGVFFQVVEEYPEIKNAILKKMATRVYEKARVSRSIVNCKPENRIIALLERQKEQLTPLKEKKLIALTRQEIANQTGLRVETVIRTINKLAKRKTLEIRDHKIYF